MGKLNDTILKFLSEHLVECRKHNYKPCRMLIVADKLKNAKQIAVWLKPIYGAIRIADDSGDDKDVSLVFDTTGERDDAVIKVNKELVQYRESHPEAYEAPIVNPPSSGNGNGGGNLPEPEEPEPEKQPTDWTTYIIIGVAALAIILLVRPKRKK